MSLLVTISWHIDFFCHLSRVENGFNTTVYYVLCEQSVGILELLYLKDDACLSVKILNVHILMFTYFFVI